MPRDEVSKSELIKLLQKVSRGSAPRIGLVPVAEESVPAMALVVVLASANAEMLAAAAEADAIAVPASTDALPKGSPSKAIGLALESSEVPSADALKGLLDQAPDFVIAQVDKAPAMLLTAKAPGKILAVDESYPPQLVRALGEMPVDAVLADTTADPTGALTVRDLLHCRQVVDLVRRPVLATADGRLSPEALPALRDMGIEGLVLRVPASTKPDELRARLAEFRKAIKELGKSIGRAREHSRDVIVPRIASTPAPEADEGPDEE